MCEFKHQALYTSSNNLMAAIHHGLQVANMGSLGLTKQARINAELKLY